MPKSQQSCDSTYLFRISLVAWKVNGNIPSFKPIPAWFSEPTLLYNFSISSIGGNSSLMIFCISSHFSMTSYKGYRNAPNARSIVFPFFNHATNAFCKELVWGNVSGSSGRVNVSKIRHRLLF